MEKWRELAEKMVTLQLRRWNIRDEEVLEAMARIPRHLFVPAEYRSEAYEDYPLPIGEGQTISQPYMVALMTELLEVKRGNSILEIGTGSGYQAAILAEMGATVISLERIESLADRARTILAELGYSVSVILADGRNGFSREAPYDGILITAATARIEKIWIEQLADGGRLVAPVATASGVEALLLRRKTGNSYSDSSHGYCRFVPLLPGIKREERT